MDKKFVKINNEKVFYLEEGKGESLVFLHGFEDFDKSKHSLKKFYLSLSQNYKIHSNKEMEDYVLKNLK